MNVERAEGGVPEGAAVTATARVDGVEVFKGTGTVPKDGKYTVKYTIDIDSTLTAQIHIVCHFDYWTRHVNLQRK